MNTKASHITGEAAAVATLQRFFSGSPSPASLKPEGVYAASDRDVRNPRNSHWLSNRLIILKHYGLVDVVHSKNNRVDRIALTRKGRDLLALTQEGPVAEKVPHRPLAMPERTITIGLIGEFLAQWEKENPSFRVTFSIDLRK